MKCMSCGSPVPPEFKSAIQNNLCPSCGGEIMNEDTLDLLDDLKDALERMPNDPEGLAGWLLSNYEMRKIGTGEPVGHFYGSHPGQPQSQQSSAVNHFYGNQGGQEGQKLPANPHYQQFIPKNQQRPPTIGGMDMQERENQLRNQPKMAPNRLQQFYQNAGIKPKTQEKYAALAQQIQGGGLGDGGDYQDYGDYEGDPYDHGGMVAEAADPEWTQAALGASMTNERPMTSQERAELQRMMSGADPTPGDEYDPSLPPALNMERRHRLQKQQELSMGGKIGKISRSS